MVGYDSIDARYDSIDARHLAPKDQGDAMRVIRQLENLSAIDLPFATKQHLFRCMIGSDVERRFAFSIFGLADHSPGTAHPIRADSHDASRSVHKPVPPQRTLLAQTLWVPPN